MKATGMKRLATWAVVLAIASVPAGCRTMAPSFLNMGIAGNESPPSANRDTMSATREDMRKLISGTDIPFSRYLIRVSGKSFLVVPGASGEKQDGLSIKESKGGLLVSLPFDLARENGLHENTDTVPITGGRAFGGKVTVLPGIYEPAACLPSWVPEKATMTLGSTGKIEYSLTGTFRDDTEKLVSFIQIEKALRGATADVIGYFATVPQLKKLLDQIEAPDRENPDLAVLGSSGPNPFALVIVRRN